MLAFRLFVLTIAATSILSVSTGCAKKRTVAENRLGTSSLFKPGANGAAGSRAGAGADGWTPGGAPGLGSEGMNGGFSSNAAGGAGGFGSGTRDGAAGGLMNTGNTSGIGAAEMTADLSMIHFDYDSYDIKPEAAATLDNHANWLSTNSVVNVQVEGHTDERGTEEYNVALGQRRADAVREYLVGKGVDANRISTISYGKQRPLAYDGTEESNGLNRRAMFLVYSPESGTSTASAGGSW